MSPEPSLGGGPTYRGVDRRRAATSQDQPIGRPFAVAAALLCVFWVLLTVASLADPTAPSIDAPVLGALLEAAGATLAVVVAALAWIHWRLSGDARALWISGGLLLFGTVTLALATLLPTIQPTALDDTVVKWLRAGSRITVIGLLAYALGVAPVDSRLRLRHVLAVAVAATAGLTVVFQLVPRLGHLFMGVPEAFVAIEDRSLSSITLGVGLFALGSVYIAMGVRGRRPLFAWLGLLPVALAMAEVTRFATLYQGTGEWAASAELVRILGLLCALVGVTVELQRSFTEQRGNLMQTTVSALAAEARIRADHALQEERAHEARNALTAIEGATRTLEHYRERLDPETRQTLATAISGEIARLQRLVSLERVAEGAAPFRLAEALSSVVTGARSQGMMVTTDVDGDLVAYGRWADTAEVVQNLLENARRYAPNAPVSINAHLRDGEILVRVEDRGPGVPEEERDTIFRRGGRGIAAEDVPGSGLGLYVSAQLMRDQGGALWVDERPGGGASFYLSIPAAQARSEAAEPVDQLDDGIQIL